MARIEREASEDEGEQQLSVDEEVKYWEDKLGIHENNEKVKQEFIKDGWDEDFFQSLDAIDDAVKERKRDLDRSEPSRQEMEDSPDDPGLPQMMKKPKTRRILLMKKWNIGSINWA
ncbi:hypothetical protein Pmar_PMAR016303 [Perkinsus marinus ATCC 50983]|uniref:Uncharacterized protein n=1 Tax=Perkinsus marinus (strain ATCC 50983 / TXsc) TaxID=423536 RepID=C5L1N1_PERM5|nr:hypothetical protein Pmar_PMAR016303 [Perkinsus marinus ATCC 50983]EER09362.1 hypothetical protein Pmar_PMAR016303 [Perkinsus marinus ATCC 50983]|eukprot:XP_002777546.1 hypothetical protein Pmar_PMAR016303 [Perkinsus marinus ATCC 50983]